MKTLEPVRVVVTLYGFFLIVKLLHPEATVTDRIFYANSLVSLYYAPQKKGTQRDERNGNADDKVDRGDSR
jgi:hypothetical protein